MAESRESLLLILLLWQRIRRRRAATLLTVLLMLISARAQIVAATIALIGAHRAEFGERRVHGQGWTVALVESMPDTQFEENFRMCKSTYHRLCDHNGHLWSHVLADSLAAKTKKHGATRAAKLRKPSNEAFKLRFLIALYFFTSGAEYRVVANQFAVSKGYASTCVKKVARLLDSRVNDYVKWPKPGPETADVREQFRNCRGYPNCVGAIDGTKIEIETPFKQTARWQDFTAGQDKMSCITATCVALPNLLFTFAYVGWPGSRTDSSVLRNSVLWAKTTSLISLGDYLFGDSGYPITRWLITPYGSAQGKVGVKGNKATFNFNHASTRVCVENAFGLLKGRFRCLKFLHVRKAQAATVVTACIVLHNMCIVGADVWHRPTTRDGTAEAQNPDATREHRGPKPHEVGVDVEFLGAAPPDDIDWGSKQEKKKGETKRNELKDFTLTCPMCRQFKKRKRGEA